MVELEGFTDSVGAMPYNVQLSQRRSEAVRRFLVEKGIEMHRIHSIGLGDVKPSADNENRQGTRAEPPGDGAVLRAGRIAQQ